MVAGVATCTTNVLTVGVHSVSGHYNGSAHYVTGTSPILTETVNQGSTTTVVGSSLNPSVSGQSVTYTATVTVVAPAAGTATGTVNFADGGVTIAGCGAKALTAAGTAICSFTYPGAGTHSITAIYSGGVDFAGSTSPALTQTVNQASTSTALVSALNPSVAGQSVTMTASVSVIAPGTGPRTGTVMFEDGGVTITGCAAQAVSAAGSALCAAAFATAGTHPITAVYSGDANFSGSTSPILIETVNQGATATVVTSSVDPSVSGEDVTYTATVAALAPASGTPTGTASFMDGATTIGGCIAQPLIGGVAACDVVYAGIGTHAITAIYNGDPNFTVSASQLLTQIINPAMTSTSLASSLNPSVTGQPVTITATVNVIAPGAGSPTGTVAFLDGGVPITGCAAQAVGGGTAMCATSFDTVGASAISAIYSGDSNLNGSMSSVFTQTINQGVTAAVIVSSANPAVAGQVVSYTASVSAVAPASGTPTGTVAFLDGASTIPGCTTQALIAGMASCAVTYAVGGSHAITASYSGDPNYAASTSASLNQHVRLAESSTTVTSPASVWAADQPGIFVATVFPVGPAHVTPTGTAAFMDAGTPIPGCAAQPVVSGNASCSVAFTGIGKYPITAVYRGDAALTGSTSPTLMLSVYDDPPTPDAGCEFHDIDAPGVCRHSRRRLPGVRRGVCPPPAQGHRPGLSPGGKRVPRQRSAGLAAPKTVTLIR